MFDLIGGTSTGGILAYLLGVKNISVNECQRLYIELASTIFGATKLAKTKNIVSSVGMETYETALLEAFSKRYMGEDISLSSLDSNDIKVHFLTVSLLSGFRRLR